MKVFLRFSILFLVIGVIAPHVHAQQSRTVTGKVTQAEDSEAIPGVSVVVKGTPSGVVTDANGNYSITNVPEKAILVFSYIGRQTQEVSIGNRAAINIQLDPTVTELTQVVVTGYTTEQRREVISSIATVSNERFKEIPVTSLDQALQGQAAGTVVQQSSGTPGGGIMVRIRGNTSISASNRPLYIIDGIPVAAGQLSPSDFGGQDDNALATINPNDVESIQILKDASAKAIYGSRGANGVVLITTKKGKANARTVITADIQRGVINPTRILPLLGSKDLLTLQREAYLNAGQDPDSLGLIPGVTDAVDTKWLDLVTRQALYQQYQISATGGNDRTRFYISASYRDEEGVQLNNRLQRYTGTLNLDHKATDQLSFGVNLTLSRLRNRRVVGDNAVDGGYTSGLRSLPWYYPYNEQGEIIVPGSPNHAGFPNNNPVGEVLLPRYLTFTTKILGGVYADYSFLPNLRFRTKISVDNNDVLEDQFAPPTTFLGSLEAYGQQGVGFYSTSSGSTVINSNILTYSKTLFEKHDFSVLLGQENLWRTGRSSNVQGQQFPVGFTYIASAATVNQGSSFLSNSGLLSFFTEVKYDYADKYLLNFTARADGSSRFGPNRKFGFFPSISAGWRISGEEFMKGFTFVEDLKLRASYGYSGNESIGNFRYLGTWGSTSYSGSVGTGPASLNNSNLQWERTREANLGLDVALLANRITFTIDVYSNLTDQLLFNQPLPTTTGFGSVLGNIGNISNRGIEFSLTSVNVDRAGIRWSTTLNVSHNRNRVDKLATPEPIFTGFDAAGAGATHAVLPGQPLGTFWGLEFLGVDPATGNAIYEDTNGDGTITADDATVIGNAQPKLSGGITNRISWNGFDLNIFFQSSYGNQILNYGNEVLLNSGSNMRINQVPEALKRWQKAGDITDVPRYIAGNTSNNWHSSRYIEDGSYLRLKNLTLGYNLKKEWTSRFKIANARIYASGTNLWMLTKYTGADPEVNTFDGSTATQGTDFFTFPQVKTWMLGLSVEF